MALRVTEKLRKKAANCAAASAAYGNCVFLKSASMVQNACAQEFTALSKCMASTK